MAYEKNIWKTGDIVTSAKLNHMEDGIGNAGGVMAVTLTYDEDTGMVTMGKTWQEIFNAISTGVLCITYNEPTENDQAPAGIITFAQVMNNEYSVRVLSASGVQTYVATYSTTSADGYPFVEDD